MLLSLQLLALLPEHRAPAEFDFIAFERQNLDQDLVAFLELVADVLDPVLGDLANVQETVGAGKISTKAPKSTRRTTLPR